MKINSILNLNVQRKNIALGKNIKKGATGWFEIPSYSKDYEGYTNAVLKLSKQWTDDKDRLTGLGKYVGLNKYQIYLENGKAKLGLIINDNDEIEHIYNEDDSINISDKYLDILKDHIKDCRLGYFAKLSLDKAEGILQL